ncbi:MAG: CHAT domain-containing tetratricopeptide repeat protein [Bacteroidota bacterium]
MRPFLLLLLVFLGLSAYPQSFDGDYDRMHMQAIKYYQNGQYQEAALLAQEALPIIEEEYSKRDEDYVAVLALLSEAYRKSGQPEKAEALESDFIQELRKASTEEELIQNQQHLYALEMNKMSINQDLSEFVDRQKQLESIGQTFQKELRTGSSEANEANMMSYILQGFENNPSEEAKALQSLITESLGPDSLAVPDNNPIQNFTKGMKDLGEKEITIPSRTQELLPQIENLPNLSLEERQNLEIALKEALQNAQSKDYLFEEQGLMNLLGLYYEFTQDYHQAQHYYNVLIETYFQFILPLIRRFTYEQVNSYSDNSELSPQSFTKILDVVNSFVYDHQAQHPPLNGLMYDNVLLGKGYLLETKRTMREGVLASGDPGLLRTYQLYVDIESKITASQNLSQSEVDSLKFASTSLRQGLSQSVALLPQPSWTDVQKALRIGEATVEFIQVSYINSDQRRVVSDYSTYQLDSILYGALVLRPDDEHPNFVSLCTQTQLADLLQIDVREKQSAGTNKRGAIVANKFSQKQSDTYDLIWQPLEELLANTKTVYYSPTGYLHQVSFAGLPHPNGMLLERYKLNQVSNTRVLIPSEQQQNPYPTSIALFGNIDYDMGVNKALAMVQAEGLTARGDVFDSPSSRNPETFTALEFTEVEVAAITKQLGTLPVMVEAYTGEHALEERFKEKGLTEASPSILHIATHGFFLADTATREEDHSLYDNALDRSGLVFAGGNRTWTGDRDKTFTRIEDGILLASEVAQLNLQNTDLVVLSACETGLGQVQGNEGVYGLQRAFREAGARYLIMSLQGVDDRKTQELMTSFYKRWLIEKQPIREAFRNAQLAMLSNGDPTYNWSNFVLIE